MVFSQKFTDKTRKKSYKIQCSPSHACLSLSVIIYSCTHKKSCIKQQKIIEQQIAKDINTLEIQRTAMIPNTYLTKKKSFSILSKFVSSFLTRLNQHCRNLDATKCCCKDIDKTLPDIISVCSHTFKGNNSAISLLPFSMVVRARAFKTNDAVS